MEQQTLESVENFYKRLRTCATSCGNIFNTNEFITRFIKGLLPGIRPSVMGTHEKSPFSTLGDVISAAIHAESTYRETTKKLSPSTARSTEPSRPVYPRNKARRGANAVTIIGHEPVAAASSHSATDSELVDEDARTGTSTRLAYELPTSSSPCAPSTPQQEVFEAHVPHMSHYNSNPVVSPPREHVGWRQPMTRPKNPTCHICFEKGHIAPDCPLVKNKNKYSPEEYYNEILQNYEKIDKALRASLFQQNIFPRPAAPLSGAHAVDAAEVLEPPVQGDTKPTPPIDSSAFQ